MKSILGNIKLLEALRKEKGLVLYVPGHGPSGGKEETIEPYLTYLKVITEEVQKAYDAEKEAYEVKYEVLQRLKGYKNWDAIDHVLGRHMDKVYAEIEANDL